jgi:hypothetical protein
MRSCHEPEHDVADRLQSRQVSVSRTA